MAMLGKKRSPRRASGVSGLAREPQPKTSSASGVTAEGTDNGRVRIERLAHDGRGVGHLASGKAIFVERALPGEQVSVATHLTRKRYDEAHIKQRFDDSPQRVEPPCVYFDRCGGCNLQHMTMAAQREHKCHVVRELFARQGLALADDIAMLYTGAEQYRRRARLGVNVDGQGRVRVGFRAAGSHRLVDIEHCHVLVPALQALLAPLREVIQRLEAPRSVGHIELIATPDTCALIVRQLKPHAGDAERWQAFADGLAHTAPTNVALGLLQGRHTPQMEWLTEPPELEETLALPGRQTLTLGFAPGDFLQANAAVNAKMVAQVLDWLMPAPGQRLLDLFAGIGNFSLPAAAAGAEVVALEGDPAMVERLADNARRNGLVVRAAQADLNAVDDVATLLAESAPDTVILDPPRAGAEALCKALANAPRRAARVAYVSCDPATLARDVAYLVAGGYRIMQVAVADMFVHTAHMETLILLQDASSPAASQETHAVS
ncbi:MAG: RsmD family RNA methyltransferase [Halomonas sp.]|nr:RsmD family RNA methyltransferase [Halomonas sp.]MDN6296777.1 RsmD family RNA methyltransferase [Halomonas sp.]MDN6314051.1 RsmD family RNA methyltransferase [Halomonas sp.]MDN6335405.1 RsmD family RNA methyltransferase [Halomonas sp.]